MNAFDRFVAPSRSYRDAADSYNAKVRHIPNRDAQLVRAGGLAAVDTPAAVEGAAARKDSELQINRELSDDESEALANEQDALAEHPIHQLTRQLELKTGVNRDIWLDAAMRWDTPLGLRPLKRADGTEVPDLLGLIPILRSVVLDTASEQESVSSNSEVPPPVWDPARRELAIGGQVVKTFRQQAPNQTAILATFQEEDWPSRIDAPISQDKLDDAVRSLNQWAKGVGLEFERDGTTEGILCRNAPVELR